MFKADRINTDLFRVGKFFNDQLTSGLDSQPIVQRKQNELPIHDGTRYDQAASKYYGRGCYVRELPGNNNSQTKPIVLPIPVIQI